MRNRQPQNPNFPQSANQQLSGVNRNMKRVQQYLLQAPANKTSIDFKYGFQDCLKLALSKLIPCEGITIDPKEGVISGEKDDCVKLKRRIQKEFNSKKFKKIEFKKQVDLQEIQYELPLKFEAAIFRQGYIERALAYLQQFSSFQYPCRKFREVINTNKTIILRIKSDYEGECMQKIQLILKNSNVSIPEPQPIIQHFKQTRPSLPSPACEQSSFNEEQSYQQVIDQSTNYYQMREQLMRKPLQKTTQQINESYVSIEEESQFNLTQTNSSMFMDEEREDEIDEMEHTNRSYF